MGTVSSAIKVKTTTIEMAERHPHDIHNISQIIAAWYGPKGCHRNDPLAKDVLDVVKQKMTNGTIPLSGQNLNNVFGDPAVGKRKCLCVEIVKKDLDILKSKTEANKDGKRVAELKWHPDDQNPLRGIKDPIWNPLTG